MDSTQWPSNWQRGLLDVSLLAMVVSASEPTYGYELSQRLREAGLGHLKGGTLYPILAKLEEAGFIATSWGEGDGGPGRKLIVATPAGLEHVARMQGAWRAFSQKISDIMDPEGART